MRDPGIMTDESAAPLQQLRQLDQREALRQSHSLRRQRGREPWQTVAFRLPANQQQLEAAGLDQFPQQLGPVRFRPVLAFTAAARVQRQSVWRPGLWFQPEARHGIGIENGQTFQWLQVGVNSMEASALIRAMRTGDELGDRTTSYVVLKNLIRVVQIR